MSRLPIIRLLVLLSVVLLYSSCDKRTSREDDINISVSIPPFADFTKQIVGNRANVYTLIPAGTNAHSFEPNPQSMKQISDSDIYFRVGSLLKLEEIFIDKIGTENLQRIVDCSSGIEIINSDPHFWLSPNNVKIITKTILNELNELYPQHRNYFSNNRKKFISSLDSIDSSISDFLKEKREKIILVYHPAWKYFARDYNLEEIAVERDGKLPRAQELKKFMEVANSRGIKCIFFDPHFDNNTVITIAKSAGLNTESLNPLPENYLKNLKDIGDKLKKYLL